MMNQLRTRLAVSTLITALLVAGMIGFALVERLALNESIVTLSRQGSGARLARELSLYVQYNAHDTNAYTLGHTEHRAEFNEHAVAFTSVLAEIQALITAGVLDDDEQESLDMVTALRARYEQAAADLFAAADTQRAAPSADGQTLLDAAWQTADDLGDQLDEASQALATHIQADVSTSQADIQARNQQMVIVLVVVGILISALIMGMQLFATRALGTPLRTLLAGVQRFTSGSFDTRVVVTRPDEIGVLAGAFNDLAVTIERQTAALQAQYAAALAAQTETEQARAQIAQQLDTIEQKDLMLREISVPVLPLSRSTLVMPLVGALDTDRLRLIQEQALQQLEGRPITYLILDITGVPVVDTQVAQGLMQVIQAARLLGTETVMVGVRPEVAQTIVELGLNFSTVTTRSTLESGITYALHRT
jgi:rsbT co-antagonist protein RsbR